MITKRDILIELLWLVGVLVISLFIIYLLKENLSLLEEGNIGLHDTYIILDNSYLGLLSILFVPLAYIAMLVRGVLTKLKSIVSFLILLVLNLIVIVFNSHFIAFLLAVTKVKYFPRDSEGWTIHPPLKDGEIISESITDTYFDSDSIGFWYSIVLFILCLSLIYFSYQLALKVKKN